MPVSTSTANYNSTWDEYYCQADFLAVLSILGLISEATRVRAINAIYLHY